MNITAEAPPSPRRTGAWSFILGFLLSVFTLMLFSCICGHLGMDALPTSTSGVMLAWFPFIRYSRTRIVEQCLAVFFVLIPTLIFLKNVADILWCGHNALLL